MPDPTTSSAAWLTRLFSYQGALPPEAIAPGAGSLRRGLTSARAHFGAGSLRRGDRLREHSLDLLEGPI
jgi:hypothetical protein